MHRTIIPVMPITRASACLQLSAALERLRLQLLAGPLQLQPPLAALPRVLQALAQSELPVLVLQARDERDLADLLAFFACSSGDVAGARV
jgi:hypothetical protein